MHLSIVIPTYKRVEKLTRCIESILKQTHQDFAIYPMCDNGDMKSFKELETLYRNHKNIFLFVALHHQYVMGCWNLFTKNSFNAIKDAMVWLVDDVELYPDCLEKAVKCFKNSYKDTDGVVGLSQECPGHPEYTYKPYGQCMIGKKFIERYPDNQVCCPDYTHFYQDEEMFEYATSLNKFVHCKDAILKHYHPGFCKSEMDSTHSIPRNTVIGKDRLTYAKRRVKGLIWGKSWELINRKEVI